MTLNKDDRLLKDSLLTEIDDNIKTLKGIAQTTVNGKEMNSVALIDETISDLATLKDLVKGMD